jgi:hypothetical protein
MRASLMASAPKPDDVLRRMLATPPKPKVSPAKAKPPKASASSANASDKVSS